MNIDKMIAVLRAVKKGKNVVMRERGWGSYADWRPVPKYHIFDFRSYEYFIEDEKEAKKNI